VQTEIPGPIVSGLKKTRIAKVPLFIHLDNEKKRIVLQIQGRDYDVKQGDWSPWVRVKFDVGLFRHVYGLCKFYLQEVKPTFSLYLTPIQVDPEAPCFPISQPETYAAELAGQIGAYCTLGIPEDTKALTEHHLSEKAFLEMCDEIVKEQEEMLWYELERFKQGLLALVFFTTDRIQHIFWATRDPEHPAFNKAYARQYGKVITEYYRRMDMVLGKLLKHVDDRTLLIICSDHGFTSFRRAVHLNTWLDENGFMTLKQRPIPSDTEGGPLFQYVDWKRTKAYALGLGGIYINLKGREGQGIVTQKEYPKLINAIRKKLVDFQDPDTGKPVVRAVYPRTAIYNGEFSEQAPDLVVGFNKGYRMSWQTAIGGRPYGLIEDNLQKWTGDHCVDPELVPGILFMNHKILMKSPRVIDIAPTVLKYFGLSTAMDGQSLI